MKKPFALFATIFVVCLGSACNLPKAENPGGLTSDIAATIVASTLTALTQPVQETPSALPNTATPTDTLTPISTPTVTFASIPTMTPTITITLAPTTSLIPKPGSIEGNISYPYGSIPNLTIVAFGQNPPYYYSYMTTNLGDTSYSMGGQYLIPGPFQVVAYDTSGHTGGCPALVTVISEQTVNCDITNWGGGYPPKPAGVP